MSEANSSLPHIAAAMTLARYYAKREVQWRMRVHGIKVHQFEASDLAKAASTYLNEHRAELIELARSQLSTFAQKRKA